jgi:cysteine desulfurase
MGAGERTYLDYNATAPIRPEAADAVARALALPGNASSVHAEGRAARGAIETAREHVAALAGAQAKHVVFTSGGTEANNAVLSPSLRRAGEAGAASLLLVGATEHVSVLEGHRFAQEAVQRIPVDRVGVIDLAWLDAELARREGRRVLVSVQIANNETGVLQPIAEVARIVHAHGGLLHADAVQAAGKVPLDSAALGADVLTLSTHKLGGPKGVGAIVLASDGIEIGDRLVRGGGQERGYRAGTENVAGIVGFGLAAELAGRDRDGFSARSQALVLTIQTRLAANPINAVVFGEKAPRLPNTLAFAIPGIRAETALIRFDLDGVAVSSGSACSSGKVRRSHVLAAMGVPPALADGAIRVSFGWNSTKEDADRFLSACEKLVATLYERRATAA